MPPLPETRSRAQESPEALTARIVRLALAEERGDVLVFLPGAREIHRVRALLEGAAAAAGGGAAAGCCRSMGSCRARSRTRRSRPRATGSRRVVLATNIAETSLTIPGVRVVVDSGLVRRLRFDPATGMSRLETERISRASAEQRQGRAGRVEPGVCYRAWSEGAQRSLAPFQSRGDRRGGPDAAGAGACGVGGA